MDRIILESKKYLTDYNQPVTEARSVLELTHEELKIVARNMELSIAILTTERDALNRIVFGSDDHDERRPGLMDAIRIEK